MPSYARRKDANHTEIRDALIALGWDVIDSYQFAQFNAGFPDLIAIKWQFVVFVEVKTATGKLTEDEILWRRAHPGAEHRVIRTVSDCVFMNDRFGRR